MSLNVFLKIRSLLPSRSVSYTHLDVYKRQVDAELGVRPGDRLTVNLPNGLSETRRVATAVGTGLTVDNTVFTVDSTELTADLVGLPGTVLHITVTTPCLLYTSRSGRRRSSRRWRK